MGFVSADVLMKTYSTATALYVSLFPEDSIRVREEM